MIQYLRPSRFRTVLAAALLVSLVQVAISCKDKAPPAPVQEQPAPATESVDSAAKIGGASASSDLVYVITLHGTVGIIPGESAKAFTAKGLKVALDAAKRAKATVVVLDIDGPGGHVLEMQNMVKVLLEAQVGGMRIVALPRDAFSAWSIVALSCKEILVTPTSRMGADVANKSKRNGFIQSIGARRVDIRRQTSTGYEYIKSSVGEDLNAPVVELCRQIAYFTGRSLSIVNAMWIQTAELWYSPSQGFSEKSGLGTDWQQVNDGANVFCLAGTQMLKTKMAIGEVKNLTQLPSILHCNLGTRIEPYYPPGIPQIGEEAFYYVFNSFVSSHWAICGGDWDTGNLSDGGFFSEPNKLRLPGMFVSKVSDSSVSFIQMAEVSCEVNQEPLTSADKLNGVEWIGMVEFHANVKRQYLEGTGWLAWENLEGYSKKFIVYKISKINGKWETTKFERVDFHGNLIVNFYPGNAPDCGLIPAGKTGGISPVVDPKPNQGTPFAPPDVDLNPETKPADTKIVDVPESKWRNGRPLAGTGLNIHTQRPVFDDKTTISAGGTNPIFEIEFDKDGVPQNCVILQSSGTQLIDQPILDCMYRWRASGSQLTDLPEGKTLKYRIRMLLK